MGWKTRKQMFHCYIILKMSPQNIFYTIFYGNPSNASIRSIKQRCKWFETASVDDLQNYIHNINHKTCGRSRIINFCLSGHIQDMLESNPVTTIRKLYNTILAEHDFACQPSVSTIYRWIKSLGYSRKVLTRYVIHLDPTDRLRYLDNFEFINPDLINDIDEIPCGRKEYEARYGYSMRGKRATYPQIIIGNTSYSVIAAYTSLGFLCWDIFSDTITEVEFQNFLDKTLWPFATGPLYGIFDNAAIHHTPDSRNLVEEIFDGKYEWCAAYSHEFKPIEKGFANVKTYLREREFEATKRTNTIYKRGI